MPDLYAALREYVEAHIGEVHEKRLESLKRLKLAVVLKCKNPYLFRAKNLVLAQDLIRALLDAHLSSQEETIFGDFLERLAIYVCHLVYGGNKSTAEGIDLEFTKDGVRYVVAVKSGPHWGNSQQIKRMKDNFKQAKRVFKTANSGGGIEAINGCCYGKDNRPEKGDYQKLCGQRFWTFISGDDALYTRIVEPLGHEAKKRNENFQEEYAKVINQFTQTFMQDFCAGGDIDWQKLVAFNSGKS